MPSWPRWPAARMARLGYDNVRIVDGDGSAGWPDEAPYDAILAAASGSHVPGRAEAAADGRRHPGHADRRAGRACRPWSRSSGTGEDEFSEEDLGAVRFVPLIGAEGWAKRRHAARLGFARGIGYG